MPALSTLLHRFLALKNRQWTLQRSSGGDVNSRSEDLAAQLSPLNRFCSPTKQISLAPNNPNEPVRPLVMRTRIFIDWRSPDPRPFHVTLFLDAVTLSVVNSIRFRPCNTFSLDGVDSSERCFLFSNIFDAIGWRQSPSFVFSLVYN